MKTFKEWIKCKIDENSPVGDLAHDVVNDSTFPNSSTRRKCRNHLYYKNACSGAVEAFNEAFEEYIIYKKNL